MGRMHVCTLCLSPYREEIKRAYGNGFKHRMVYEKYSPLMKYKGDFNAWKQMVWRHKDHNYQGSTLLPGSMEKTKKGDLRTLVEGLTDLGVRKMETMDPGDIKFRDVFQAHKTEIEYRKLRLSEDAMMIALGKLFGPPLEGKVVEGEEVKDELPSAGRIEDGGLEPANPQ